MPLRTIIHAVPVRPITPVLAAAIFMLSAQSLCAADVSGRYAGAWSNCHDDSDGSLNVELERCGPCEYKAKFWGIALVNGAWPYQYSTKLTVKGVQNGKVYLHGQHWLPPFGYYFMCAEVDGCQFFARFEKTDGCGYIVMKRSGDCCPKRQKSCKGCCRP